MNLPEFTAEASLYKSNNRYRSSGSEDGGLLSGESIELAYFPGPAAKEACNKCLTSAVSDYFECIAFEGFPFSLIHCTLKAWYDSGACVVDDCCPKRCGPPDFGDLAGSGCCDANEQCVDRNDRNSRSGCCPSDQSVCAGKCCAKGESCCGDTCCPANYFCRDGFCSEFPSPLLPPPGTPTPTPPRSGCPSGSAPCGFPDSSGVIRTCCPPGLQCCGYSAQFGPECAAVCIR